jgi:ubiquinone/menaquinone biosynthesis C-methylase UbiE
MNMESSQSYLPAAGHDWLLPLYDPIVKLRGGDAARKALLDQAALQPGQQVLEVGCGTGSMVVQIKKLHPEVDVVGLDPDPKALARARSKAKRLVPSIQFDAGFAGELPYPDGSFDRVFSSFMFHHLPADEKRNMLAEARRVLRQGGELHILDFEGSEDGAQSFFTHLLHSRERLKDNSEGTVLRLMRGAGFAEATKLGRRRLVLGGVAYYRARA